MSESKVGLPLDGPSLRGDESQETITLSIIGGKRIFRESLGLLLGAEGLSVLSAISDDDDLQAHLAGDGDTPPPDVLLLLLTGGPFSTFHRIGEAMKSASSGTSLVVLSEQANRGQVYAALRVGAKAYVHMDSEPAELLTAVRMAAAGRVYLSPDAAQLVVDDISATSDSGAGAQRLPSADLSRREIEIVQLLCEGLSSKEVARRLHISPKTVENHRYNIYRKVDVDSIAALMRHAIQHGMVTI